MSIFKCKMCGGSLEIVEGSKTCTCEFCGTEQTLPSVRDENVQGLFNRATVLRMKSEFDKAAEIYEKIIQNNPEEAEAYWGMILCKYGIEYVEDPATYKRIPTCHRASYDAVVSDDDYKNAIAYADMTQKAIYEEQAKQIDEIQKGIIALAQSADPYDVFICYKETDENGKRTQDSVIANDIYYQLTQEGFKVFYAAITLEDKLGTEYEPYIFSALNTAKVMLSIGTKPEYFNAVWVKNEWSRFLKIMKKDRSKLLIPCYRDMDAYELPEEFAHLQAQDMSKIGFINDIVRGIKKVIVKDDGKTTANEPVIIQQAAPVNSNVQALLDRGYMALEDGNWEKADGFFEDVLNQDAKCAEAYIGQLLAKYRVSNIQALTQKFIAKYEDTETEELEACPVDIARIDESVKTNGVINYLSDDEIKNQYRFELTYLSELSFRKKQKAQLLSELEEEKLLARARQYASGNTKAELDNMFQTIETALDNRINNAQNTDNESIASITKAYAEFLDSVDAKVQEQNKLACASRESDYNSRIEQMNAAKTIAEYQKAIDSFKQMNGYKDSEELAEKCKAEVNRLMDEAGLEREKSRAIAKKKKKTVAIIAAAVTICAIAFLIILNSVIIPNNKYNAAKAYLNDKNYVAAYKILRDLDGYKDSAELKESIKEEYKWVEIATANIGDIIQFGNYNGNTEWRVLVKEEGKILVISRYAIEKRPYNTEFTSVTWETCTLRKWLNETYIQSAFTNEEQAMILPTSIINSDNPEYGTTGGNNTTDKVFLLSIDEFNKYFTPDTARKATLADGSRCCWWLRSPGDRSDLAADVFLDGSVSYHGGFVDGDIAVRPALWINLE